MGYVNYCKHSGRYNMGLLLIVQGNAICFCLEILLTSYTAIWDRGDGVPNSIVFVRKS